LGWQEVADCDPGAFTVASMPARFARLGDLHAEIDRHPFDIAELLRWAEQDEAHGLETPQE